MAMMTTAARASQPIPLAAKKPHSFTARHHDHDYAWLRDPGYPEVKDAEILAHLEAENAWFEARWRRASR
jgi:oligopeptidase B